MRSYAARKFLPARRVFRTSRDAKSGVENVFLALEQDGLIGFGEASPNRYFNEYPDEVHLRLLGFADFLRRQSLHHPGDIAHIWEEAETRLRPSRAALCAVDLALWDLWGKISHRSVPHLLWQQEAEPLASSVTLSISGSDDLQSRIEEVADYPMVKVKMDSSGNLSVLKQLREAGTRRLLVDANASWTPEQCASWLPRLAALEVEAVEQPLPPRLDAAMPALKALSPIPLLADESCTQAEDIGRLAGQFSGINIKLVKCGGITPALAMLKAAREKNLKVMVGCMLETQLLISAGLSMAQKADWADLDGSWLLADDPFEGLLFRKGELHPGNGPGLGVALKPGNGK